MDERVELFGTSAIGVLTYDTATHTLYAGTGEQNESADSDAGVGIYKSTNGGDTWTLLPGSPAMSAGNSVAAIVPAGNTLYVATTFGVAGMAGVGGGALPSFIAPGVPKPGLWKSTDDGSTFSLMFDDSAGAWGINDAEMDATGTLYIASVGKGIYRSSDGGSTWEQVFATQLPVGGRVEFALNTKDGHTRIYVGDGGSGPANTGVFRADSIDTTPAATLTDGTTNPGYTKLSTSGGGMNPGYIASNYCTGQCWYDNFVVSPAGSPDTVYVGGSFDYNLQPFGINNGRAVVLSTDAGAPLVRPGPRRRQTTEIHPDQHALVVTPDEPAAVLRRLGRRHGALERRDDRRDVRAARRLGDPFDTICANANSAVPTRSYNLNAGLVDAAVPERRLATRPTRPT